MCDDASEIILELDIADNVVINITSALHLLPTIQF